MGRCLSTINNSHGSAMVVVVMLLPVLTLLVVFALNTGTQNIAVTTNDDCHRDALYNSDAAIYGTSKLISLINKSEARDEVSGGTSGDAPGVQFYDSSGTLGDDGSYFVTMAISEESQATGDDLEFKMVDAVNNIGIKSKVDIRKFRGESLGGGGAEFGSAAEGLGAQLNIVRYEIRSQGQGNCINTTLPVRGEYIFIASKAGQTKGI